MFFGFTFQNCKNDGLVKITSLRYHASMDFNIVGGEVNVALISKFDGFVLVKKEEYYSRELNDGKF